VTPIAGLAPQQTDVSIYRVHVELNRDLPNGLGRDVLVGMTTDQALQAARDAGVEVIRVLDTVNGVSITPMTMDLSPARLSLRVEAGVVLGASFG
jgi:hypothetical protein